MATTNKDLIYHAYQGIPFEQLNGNEESLEEIPTYFKNDEVEYSIIAHPSCKICSSPYRTIAENVYLKTNKTVVRVQQFFKKYYGAYLSTDVIRNHMSKHCDFRNISVSGLQYLKNKADEYNPWNFREIDLSIALIMEQVDVVQGLDVGKTTKSILQKSNVLKDLAKQLAELKKVQDQLVYNSDEINIMDILLTMHEKMETENDKRVIIDAIRNIREKITNA